VTKENGMWPPDVILVWPQNDFLKGNVTGHIPGHISKCKKKKKKKKKSAPPSLLLFEMTTFPFFLGGIVCKGFGRGSKELGIPTGIAISHPFSSLPAVQLFTIFFFRSQQTCLNQRSRGWIPLCPPEFIMAGPSCMGKSSRW